MKKTKRALALDKQTIANLNPDALVRATGGMEAADGIPGGPCSTIPACAYPGTAFQCITLISCKACSWPC
jgi:hypothetical protein